MPRSAPAPGSAPAVARLAAMERAAKVYAVTRSYSEAAREVGVSPNVVYQWAREYPEWSQMVERAANLSVRVTGVTVERVLVELATIAFADIRDVLTWETAEDGTPTLLVRPSAELTPEQARAIEAVEIDSKGRLRVRLASKTAALGQLLSALAGNPAGADHLTDLLDEIAPRRRQRTLVPGAAPIDVTPVEPGAAHADGGQAAAGAPREPDEPDLFG